MQATYCQFVDMPGYVLRLRVVIVDIYCKFSNTGVLISP